MISTDKLYKVRCQVGATVQSPLAVCGVQTMEEAINEVLVFYADHPDHQGEAVRVVETGVIEVAKL